LDLNNSERKMPTLTGTINPPLDMIKRSSEIFLNIMRINQGVDGWDGTQLGWSKFIIADERDLIFEEVDK